MKSKIAFILDHNLHHYRIPLFEELEKYYAVTVFHRGPFIDGTSFQQQVLSYKSIGPFELIMGLPSLLSYDAVVIMQNLRLLNVYTLPFKLKHKSALMWGIGTSSSNGLGAETMLSIFFRNAITSLYSGLGLYSAIPISNYWKRNQKKISIVGNSVFNDMALDMSNEDKRYFLFIGSLNKRKGLNDLLSSFQQALFLHSNLQLKIVGSGPEKERLEQRATELGLMDNVEFLGAIHGSSDKKHIFANAYCVISPSQAGLSVVESFSYGIPFVTSSKAITGGESHSISHEKNGILFREVGELSDIMCSFVDGRRSSATLGGNAYQFYAEHLAFDLYVQRFKKFIDGHLKY